MEGHPKQREEPGWKHRDLEQPESFGELHVAHFRKCQDMIPEKSKKKRKKRLSS